MLGKLLKFGRRQLHTIVSREIIKPLSPTPSYSKTYNLSLFDQIVRDSQFPFIAFYQNHDQSVQDKARVLELKKSLSKTITHHYPFAGRIKKSGPTYIDCNDEGVEYIEASNNNSLADFLKQSVHEDFDQLVPNDLIWFDPHIRGDTEGVICPLAVQVNRFACGGIAVALTLSHKVGDGRTLLNFMNHWATMSAKKDTSLINPQILHYQSKNVTFPELLSPRTRDGCVTRSFLFPNQKLNELKAKVTAMTMEAGQPITNPTRVEALSWILHNRAMAASTKRSSGTFKPSGMAFPIDLRGILAEKLPGTRIGNIIFMIEFPTVNQSDLDPHITIGEMRKQKAAFQSIPNFETATEIFSQMSQLTALETSKRLDSCYIYSSLCRFPTYDIDFGWGKPAKVTVAGTFRNGTVLLPTPDNNGIEALMCLEKEDMKMMQNDPELLAYC